jgi:anti-sigma B factor antagonist
MTTPLELSTRRGGGATVLAAVGEIDMSNAARFRDALGQAIGDGGGCLVDLTGVGYLDSAGLTVLLHYAPRIKIIATAMLAPVLAVTGLDPVTTVVPAPKPVGRQPPEERPRSPRERQDQA